MSESALLGTGASSWSPKDGSGSGGFLAKASNSLRRSPSKKPQGQQPSTHPMPALDGMLLENALAKSNTAPSRPGVTQFRPQFKRAPPTPLDVHPPTTHAIHANKDPLSAVETTMSTLFGNGPKKTQTSVDMSVSGGSITKDDGGQSAANGANNAGLNPAPPLAGGSQNPHAIYQHIHEMANKRISTLDYLRKAHEGRVYWFNTVHFSRTDLSRLHSFAPTRLSRRATNYLLLGLSIPAVLDVHPLHAGVAANPSLAHEFLRSLNALLAEFDTFQQLHPPDGSSASSLSRARIPQMFKRATHSTTGKPRRTSSAAGTEIGLPIQQVVSGPSPQQGPAGDPHHHHSSNPSMDTSTSSYSSSASTLVTASPGSSVAPPAQSFPSSYSSIPGPSQPDAPNSVLLPNEGPYAHLLTPPLPFVPDFYSIFATLCDVLIDAYQRILHLVNSPSVCTAGVGDVFGKADARLRKVIVGGVIKEFESAARESGRREVLGVQKVVLGGLMGG